MVSFEFKNPTNVIFGNEKSSDVGSYVKEYGAKKVLIHYGGKSAVNSGLLSKIKFSLSKESISYIELGGVLPNPRTDKVREGIRLCKKENIDFILAVGGGSVIDSAKGIALGVCNNIDIWKIYTGWTVYTKALPIGVVLTLPGSGSESGSGSVLSNMESKQKVLYSSDGMRPRFCIIDPTLYLTIPDNVRWPAICDMMSHVMERYFTDTNHTELTDGLCEITLRTLIHNAELLRSGENNTQVWGELALAANIAHNGVCGMGRKADWACHAIEHEISAMYDVTHGCGLSILTPAWMKYVYRHNIPIFAQFATNVMGIHPNRDSESLAREGIKKLEQFFKKLGLPVTLEELIADNEEAFEMIAKKTVLFDEPFDYYPGSIKSLDWQDIVEILKLAQNPEASVNW